MNAPHDGPDDEDLQPALDHHDLTNLITQEQQRREALNNRGWVQVINLLALRSKAAYSVADSQIFTRCLYRHMSGDDRDEMMDADVYTCPECATLLKDRKSPAASSILLERGRLRAMWLDIEHATVDELDEKLERFRRALGLTP